jgi:hypothetical protein
MIRQHQIVFTCVLPQHSLHARKHLNGENAADAAAIQRQDAAARFVLGEMVWTHARIFTTGDAKNKWFTVSPW